MRLRRKVLLGQLGIVLLVPPAALYWVATTESGLRFVVQRLDVVGPVKLTIEAVSGTLTQGVRIGALRVQHRLSDIRIEEAEGRVQLLPLLLRRHIEVPRFTARSVSITLLEDPVQRPRRQPRFLPAQESGVLQVPGHTRLTFPMSQLPGFSRGGIEIVESGTATGALVVEGAIYWSTGAAPFAAGANWPATRVP
jgi:hypothetical protein